jgi:transposase-like protein
MSSNDFNFNFRGDSWFERDNPQDIREARIKALLEEFKRRFPTRADCVRELCKHKFEFNDVGELLCPYCRFPKAKIDYTKRSTKCKKCKRKIWLTAGTFFHKSKKPEAWLAIIWFIEAGLILSSLRFHDLLGIAQSTAWTMLQTILQAVRLQLEASEGWSELNVTENVDTATLISSAAFIEVFLKRSLETPKREHPSKEEEEQVKEWFY